MIKMLTKRKWEKYASFWFRWDWISGFFCYYLKTFCMLTFDKWKSVRTSFDKFRAIPCMYELVLCREKCTNNSSEVLDDSTWFSRSRSSPIESQGPWNSDTWAFTWAITSRNRPTRLDILNGRLRYDCW